MRCPRQLHVTALRGDLLGWHVAAAASENPSPAARALLAQLSEAPPGQASR